MGRYAGNRVDQQNKWANEMAQQGELPVDKPNSLSSIPGIQRRLRLINCHLTSTSMLWRTLPYPCKYLNMIDKETTPLNLPSVLFNFMTFSTAQIFPLYEALILPWQSQVPTLFPKKKQEQTIGCICCVFVCVCHTQMCHGAEREIL